MKAIEYLSHNRIKRVLTAGLVLAMLFTTGCGQKTVEAPELLEPISQAGAYRPVSKRVVGQIKTMFSEVVPADYPVYPTKTISIADVSVGIGDYVEAGTVVATAVESASSDQIESLEAEIASLGRQRTKLTNVSNSTVTKLGFEKSIEEFIGNSSGVILKEREISTEEENLRYQLAVIDTDISTKRDEVSDLENDLDNQTFTAPYSGYVTFIKDFSVGNVVQPYENIIVISDYSELYLEVKDVTIDKYLYSKFESKWTMINGQKVDIVERNYSNSEISYARSVQRNPYMSFELTKGQLTLGTNQILYFLEGDNTEKLAVGNDSIIYENNEKYVLVKGSGEGDEKRRIETGVTDGSYTEVLSGLEEGELVYYKNSMSMPSKYEAFDVELSNYTEKLSTETVKRAYTDPTIYTAACPGVLTLKCGTGTISAGEELFNLKSTVGSAEIEDARQSMEDCDTELSEAALEYENSRKEYEQTISGADQFDPATMGTETDAVRENMYQAEINQCNLDILTYEYKYNVAETSASKAIYQDKYDELTIGTSLDGLTISTENGGQIDHIDLKGGQKLEKNDFIMTVEEATGDDKFYGLMKMDGHTEAEPRSPKLGQSVTFTKDGKSWTGKITGINGDKDRFMLFTRDDKQFSTYSSPFNASAPLQYYFELEEELDETYLTDCSMSYFGVEMDDVVVLPSTAVHTEVDMLTREERNYVWKVEDGQIVKEFVTIYETDAVTGVVYILYGVEVGDQVIK